MYKQKNDTFVQYYFCMYTPRERSSGKYIGITLSVCLSVCLQIRVRPITFFLVRHWLTIFGAWVYHHETMCRVHSWSQYDVYLWLQSRIYRVYEMALCKSAAFLSFDIAMLCLARVTCFPMVRCVTYIHDLCMTLTVDITTKIILLPGIWGWTNFVYILDLCMTLTFDLYVGGYP